MLTGEPPRTFANAAIDTLPDAVRGEEWADELLRVLIRATNADPRQRQQTVEELWGDLALIRQIADDGEYSTVMRSIIDTPQPHVTRGYTPIAPERPSFEAIAEMPSTMSRPPIYTRPAYVPPIVAGTAPLEARPHQTLPSEPVMVAQPKRRRTFRRLAGFLVIVCAFTGILYGTASFIRSRNIFPGLTNPLRTQTGVASTDIYLRPQPNTDNDPIGLVTKNSKIKIVNSQNNWYQVDVVQQGRNAQAQGNATRGWLNGKYIEISEN
jgi:hypothetical protein